jgi:hypothetical protein
MYFLEEGVGDLVISPFFLLLLHCLINRDDRLLLASGNGLRLLIQVTVFSSRPIDFLIRIKLHAV